MDVLALRQQQTMTPQLSLCLATSNQGKLTEYRRLLAGLPIQLISAADLGLPSPAEARATFVENALDKARAACMASGLASLAEDAGLCVPALGMQPGLHSARFAPGTDRDRIDHLLHCMTALHDDQRCAFFHCTAVLMRHADDPVPWLVQGQWHGHMLKTPQGSEGFGYDPVFCGQGCGQRSAAELLPAEKDRLSHRGKAMRHLRRLLAHALHQGAW